MFKDHLNNNFSDFYIKVRELTESVIIYYTFKFNVLKRKVILTTFNGSLKKIRLMKVLEPHQVIQEIKMYLNMVNNNSEDIFLNDKQKRDNAGFDDKLFKH